MAYDSDELSPEATREQAKRETELALERERLHKENEERLHKENLKRKLEEKESDLEKKEHEKGAIELERSHLEHVVRDARRTPTPSSQKSVSAIDRLLRETKAKLDSVLRTKRLTEEKDRATTRRIDEVHSEEETGKAKETATLLAHRRLEDEEEQKRREDERIAREIQIAERALEGLRTKHVILQKSISDIERKLTEHGSSSERGHTDTSLREHTRIHEELTRAQTEAKEEERKLKAEVERLTRELGDAKQKERESTSAVREQEDRGRTASSREAEQDREATTLTNEIDKLKREVQDLKRELS